MKVKEELTRWKEENASQTQGAAYAKGLWSHSKARKQKRLARFKRPTD